MSAYCASLPMKRDQKFAFANSSSHGWFAVVQTENCDFDKGMDGNVALFWYVIVVTM